MYFWHCLFITRKESCTGTEIVFSVASLLNSSIMMLMNTKISTVIIKLILHNRWSIYFPKRRSYLKTIGAKWMGCSSKLPTANTQILRSTVLKLGVRLSLCPGFVYPSFVTKNSELLVQNPYDAFLNTWYLKFVKHSTSCVTTIVVMGLISFHSLPYLYFTLLTSCSPFSWLCFVQMTIQLEITRY